MAEGVDIETVRAALRDIMDRKGIKPTTLSLMVGKNKSLVKDLFERTNDISVSTLTRIAGALGTGNDFFMLCQDSNRESDSGAFGLCSGYIAGFLGRDQLQGEARSFCFGQSVTNGQLMDVLMKFIRDNPENRNRPLSVLSFVAFAKAFPCPKK